MAQAAARRDQLPRAGRIYALLPPRPLLPPLRHAQPLALGATPTAARLRRFSSSTPCADTVRPPNVSRTATLAGAARPGVETRWATSDPTSSPPSSFADERDHDN